jgi:O-antigen/teichoic acid export membrane protein
MSACSVWSKVQRSRPLAANTVITATVNLVLAVLGMMSGVLAARLLGPHGRGELAAIQTWPGVIGTLAMLGMPEAIVYYSARDERGAGRYLGSAVIAGRRSLFSVAPQNRAIMESAAL